MKIERIDRVVIAVKNLYEAMKFFSDLLGIKFDPTGSSGEQLVRAAYSPSGIELMEATQPDSPVGKFVEKRGEGLYAVVFKVPNIEEANAEFERKGIRNVGKLDLGALKESMFHPKNTHGVMIILAEYEDVHPATAAVALSLLQLQQK
nr:VOC family protein [Candidatus Freyarchaeota archaeon]